MVLQCIWFFYNPLRLQWDSTLYSPGVEFEHLLFWNPFQLVIWSRHASRPAIDTPFPERPASSAIK
jgi:hypothetical protein